MNPAITESYRRIADRLIAEFPELADDPETLQDTMDGLHGAQDIIASLIRKSREDERMAMALKSLMDEYQERGLRLLQRSKARKDGAMELMGELGLKKIERPEFTLTVSQGPQSVIITDASKLPDTLFSHPEPVPDKTRIKAALLRDDPEAKAGASLSNGSPVLRVLVR